MNSTETPSDAFRWLDPAANPLWRPWSISGTHAPRPGRVAHLFRTRGFPGTMGDLRPLSGVGGGIHRALTELRGAEDAPLPKSLVNATLEFVEKGLGRNPLAARCPCLRTRLTGAYFGAYWREDPERDRMFSLNQSC